MKLLQARAGELDADGAARVEADGREYAVHGAAPGEWIEFDARKKRRGKHRGVLTRVIEPSPARVEPRCRYFGVCGGCTLQHLDAGAQVALKEAALFERLAAAGVDLDSTTRLPAAHGAAWNYRRKARLGARFVPKKGGILVGFRERGGGFITALQECPVLDARLSKLLPALHETLGRLSVRESIPQLEVAAADNAVALVLRHLRPLSAADEAALKAFAARHDVRFYLQPGGLDSVAALRPGDDAEALVYRLKNHDVRLQFAPTDFIQINPQANDLMLNSALELLRPAPGDSILDLFCGIGNFTLPIARTGAKVLGIEGDPALVRRAEENAKSNGISCAEFQHMDLNFPPSASPKPSPESPTSPPTSPESSPLTGRKFDKILLDPPRSGAQAAIDALIPAAARVIVYVSCNPLTLARDAARLTRNGHQLTHAGIIDMFPHTAQVESIARFEKSP